MKERLDILLVNKGIFPSREAARRTIMAGEIFIGDKRIDKCGSLVDIDSDVVFKGDTLPYVSRGGLKLEKAIKNFSIDLKDKKCIDIGASTGGFTDCMLQNGALKVFSVDVGYGQFAWKLRCDSRVTLLERTNIRYVKKEDLGEECDFASIDVSFISLALVLPVAKALLGEKGEIVALIKPQFEAGREKVGKKGVVKSPETHKEVIEKIVKLAKSLDLQVKDIDFSPIKGPEGNIEYLIYLDKNSFRLDIEYQELINQIVEKAHTGL